MQASVRAGLLYQVLRLLSAGWPHSSQRRVRLRASVLLARLGCLLRRNRLVLATWSLMECGLCDDILLLKLIVIPGRASSTVLLSEFELRNLPRVLRRRERVANGRGALVRLVRA